VSGTYVATFYLGGTEAGLVYPPFIGQSAPWSLEVALLVCVLAVLLAKKTLR